MVEREALPALASGREVWSNFRIGSPHDPTDWLPGAYSLTHPEQLLELRSCTVLLDEITSVFPARQAMSLPPDVQRVLNQFRKRDITIGWSAPNWLRADKMLREVTQSVTTCRAFGREFFARDRRGHVMRYDKDGLAEVPGYGPVTGTAGKRVRWPNEWPPRVAFRFSTYAAVDFEEFSINAAQKIKATKREWYLRRRHQAYRSYSTLEELTLFGHLDESGICVHCGGTRKRKSCSCTPLDAFTDGAGAPAPEPAEDVAVP